MILQRIEIPSQPLIDSFPFPFKGDTFRYSNNATPLNPPGVLDITSEYFKEIELKRALRDSKKEQTFQSFTHSIEAQWEILDLIMHEMTKMYPAYFNLSKDKNDWVFHNYLLGEKQSFTFGELSSLPYEPLDFIGRHIQEDLIYLSQRDGKLYMDAGQLCFPADWSIAFDLGMEFLEIHTPVPQSFTGSGLVGKVRDFISRIEAGEPWTRYNWTLTVEPILETAPETYGEWGVKKANVTSENAGQLVNLRVEDQRLFRLPRSNGILFSIHTHLITLEELITNDNWKKQFYNVINDIPDEIVEYKGFSSYKDKVLQYLELR